MLFNSVQFLVFFPVVTALFFWLEPRRRLGMLLAASCVFYMAFVPAYILILFLLIAIDYTAAIWMERVTGRWRLTLLVTSLAATVAVLAVFKYYNFFATNLTSLLSAAGSSAELPLVGMLLPIGLSFHTFQSMSYTIEVYRRRVPAERSLLKYSLYVLFYPQMVAGPIERPYNLLPQFHRDTEFDIERVLSGLHLMLWGFFKKVVIADRLALYSSPVFSQVGEHDGATAAVGILAFSFQIYCDFSGYSDIAIGAARVMGYRLMTNFDRPYGAGSISEFWSRWHISLSTWFRDYVYIPLGGNRVSRPRWYFNLMFVFVVSGFWHGANWTFLIWGALHGTYLIVGIVTGPLRERLAVRTGLAAIPKLRRGLSVLGTFVLVTLAWIFFRAASVADALALLRGLFAGRWRTLTLELPFGPSDLVLAGILVAGMLAAEAHRDRIDVASTLAGAPRWLRFSLYYVAIFGILLLGVLSQQEFIYFQF